MCKKQVKNTEKPMDITMMNERPCTVTESLIQSCQEVKLMREGKIPKRKLDNLFSCIDGWVEGEDE